MPQYPRERERKEFSRPATAPLATRIGRPRTRTDEPLAGLLAPYQAAWVSGGLGQRRLWLGARQVGKDFALSLAALIEALGEADSTWLLLSATQYHAREMLRTARRHGRAIARLRPRLDVDPTDGSLEEWLLPHGSRIVSRPATPEAIQGTPGHIILNEYGIMRDAASIYEVAVASSRGRHLWIAGNATHRGTPWHRLWEGPEAAAYHRTMTTVEDALAAGRVTPEAIGVERASLSADAWTQWYMCGWRSPASSYYSPELLDAASEDYEPGSLEGRSVVGMDLGRHQDPTAIVRLVQHAERWHVVGVEVLRQVPYETQLGRLGVHLEHAERAVLDATGAGDPVLERARDLYGARVTGVTFTVESRGVLFEGLRLAFERRLLVLPRWDLSLRAELDSIRQRLLPSGRVVADIERTATGHGDRAVALALAWEAASASVPSPVLVRPERVAGPDSGLRAAWGGQGLRRGEGHRGF